MRLLDYLDRGCVSVSLTPDGKEGTLRQLVDLVVASGMVDDPDRVIDALRRREEVVSTAIGNGIAIPHADLPEIETPRLGLGIVPEGVDFDALDEEPVFAIFLLLGTPKTPGLHMKILARIARLSKDPEFADLRRAESVEDACGILERIESRRPW